MVERGDVSGLRASFAKSSRIAVEGDVASWKCRSSDAQGDIARPRLAGNGNVLETATEGSFVRVGRSPACSHRAITRIGCARCADDDDDAASSRSSPWAHVLLRRPFYLREAPWMSASMTVVAQKRSVTGPFFVEHASITQGADNGCPFKQGRPPAGAKPATSRFPLGSQRRAGGRPNICDRKCGYMVLCARRGPISDALQSLAVGGK